MLAKAWHRAWPRALSKCGLYCSLSPSSSRSLSICLSLSVEAQIGDFSQKIFTLPALGILASLHSRGPFSTLWACGKDHSPPLCPLLKFALLIFLSLFLAFYLPASFSFLISSHYCVTPSSPSHRPSPPSLILHHFCPDYKSHHPPSPSYHDPDDPQLTLRPVRTSLPLNPVPASQTLFDGSLASSATTDHSFCKFSHP